jgi:hypothetical protein
MRPSRELIASVNTSAFLVTNQKDEPITSGLLVIQDQPRTEHISEMGTSHQHGFVKRYGLVRDDRHEAPPVMVPFGEVQQDLLLSSKSPVIMAGCGAK